MAEERLSGEISEDDHIQGAEDAPVTLVEYGDYECPACGAAYPIVKAIRKQMGDKLRFVFRNFPLAQTHPHAKDAAEAAESAGAQGKFWEMHDILFENQKKLTEKDLLDYAKKLGLDENRFATDLQNDKYQNKIQADLISGAENNVNGTPSFFINGARFDGRWDSGKLLEAIKEASGTIRTNLKR